MIHPKFSILVPIYGTEEYIEKCCHSLFNQDYENVEFIFVNDCTKDRSIEVLNATLKKYPHRTDQVKVINHTQNRGLGAARLTGLENYTGDYVWFVDSDDYISNNAISYISNIIVKGGHDLITFSYNEVNGDVVEQINVEPFSIQDLLIDRVTPSIWKNVVKRSLFYNHKIFPIEGVNYAEDLHLFYRLLIIAENRITLKDHYLYNYNVANVGSMMHNVNKKSLLNLFAALMIVFEFYKSKNKLFGVKPFLARFLAISLLKFEDYEDYRYREEYDVVKSLDKIIYIIISSHLKKINKLRLIFLYTKIHYLLTRKSKY